MTPTPRIVSPKTIEITVSSKGDVKVETKGFTGAACRDASWFIEHAFGERTGESLTAEFHRGTTSEPVRAVPHA